MTHEGFAFQTVVIASLLAGTAGCRGTTGTAETIRQNKYGGLVRYEPESALAKAQYEAEQNCGERGYEIVERGKVMVGRETVEKSDRKSKARADVVEDDAETSARATIQAREERRLRYMCKDAPTGYEPPPMDMNTITENAPSKPASVNITTGK
jgi:hypothetical protein